MLKKIELYKLALKTLKADNNKVVNNSNKTN